MATKRKTGPTEARRKLNEQRKVARLKRMKSPHWKKALQQQERKTPAKGVRVNVKRLERLRLPKLSKEYKLEKVNIVDPVDMVITWVDMQDPVWRKKYIATTGKQPNWKRFKDSGELELSLFTISKYMPWIRTIYVITDGQQPDYISDYPKVKIVDHKEILSKECTKPTFNSNVIESHMHRIPGLSEVFLWGNDDFMVGKPIKKSDWFRNGSPLVTLTTRKIKYPVRGFERFLYNTINLASNFIGYNAGEHDKIITQSHQISILNKSACKKVWELYPKELDKLFSTHTRQPHEFQFQFHTPLCEEY